MKRETRKQMVDIKTGGPERVNERTAEDILATDAEVKRLRRVLRELEHMASLRWQEVEALKLAVFVKSSTALKPQVARERKRR